MDVLIVSLGSTPGLRASDDELAASLRRAGAAVQLVRASAQRNVPTFAMTDLLWARAARRAAFTGIGEFEPRALIYSTTTAALFWPQRGAIRFDALAADNRPGRHGFWQRGRERKRLEQATALIPVARESLAGAPHTATPTIVVPIPVEPSAGAGGYRPQRDIAAITYAADPVKKGLDRVLAAWRKARRGDERLLVAGRDGEPEDGVDYLGRLDRDAYRALLRRARLFVTAPRREDYGIAQLEALADGCRVVTTPAPGPYAALPLLRSLEPGFVVDDDEALPGAIRAALDVRDDYPERAARALNPFRREAVDRIVANELLPRLLG